MRDAVNSRKPNPRILTELFPVQIRSRPTWRRKSIQTLPPGGFFFVLHQTVMQDRDRILNSRECDPRACFVEPSASVPITPWTIPFMSLLASSPFDLQSRFGALALTIRRWPLGVHLLLAVNVPLAIMLAALLVIEYRDEMDQAIQAKEGSLADEAIAVHQAVAHITHGHSVSSTKQFIESVCEKMQDARSPGHAIVVVRGDNMLHSNEHGHMTLDADAALLKTFRSGLSRLQWRNELIVLGGHEEDGTAVVIAEQATNIRRAARVEVLWQLVTLAILALIAAAIVDAVLWRLIRSPLRRMSAKVKTIARGEFGVMLESPVGRELQHLTRSFNTMSGALATDDRRRHREIQRAREIQQHLLPNGVNIPGLTIATDYQPAEDVAGDYYDLLPLADGSWLLVIADVAGHGISAAMAATLLKALLLCESENLSDPTDILSHVNRRMASLLPTGVFVTVLLAAWNPNNHRLTYVNAGHPPGLLWNPRDGFRELAASALPVGVMPEVEYASREMTLNDTDRLVLVTDGLLEAAAPTGELFGTNRLKQLIVNHDRATSSELLNAILIAVRAFAGDRPLQDDLTLLVANPL